MKTEQLQIRISPEQKEFIRKRASESGLEMSAWILSQLFSKLPEKFAKLVHELSLSQSEEQRFLCYAAISDFLHELSETDLASATEQINKEALAHFDAAYLAAMVETACHQKNVQSPQWVRETESLPKPYFGTTLQSLRLHLLINSPPAFRKRNIFIDSSIGDRV